MKIFSVLCLLPLRQKRENISSMMALFTKEHWPWVNPMVLERESTEIRMFMKVNFAKVLSMVQVPCALNRTNRLIDMWECGLVDRWKDLVLLYLPMIPAWRENGKTVH